MVRGDPVRFDTISIIGGQIQLQTCTLYKGHHCAIIEHHHIAPNSWWVNAGVSVQTPFADLCPNCHMNTHAAIDGTIKAEDISLLPRRCRKLAAQAFTLATLFGLTPTPTL